MNIFTLAIIMSYSLPPLGVGVSAKKKSPNYFIVYVSVSKNRLLTASLVNYLRY